jgi:hypothetical protein
MTIHWTPGYGPGESSATQQTPVQQATISTPSGYVLAIPQLVGNCGVSSRHYKVAESGKWRLISTKTLERMRRAAKVDANQGTVIKALRSVGAFVQPLHTIGQGCPDLLVGYRGKWSLMELKDGTKSPSQRKLTDEEQAWHEKAASRAPVFIAESAEDALLAIGAITARE